jgi:diacylglycerol kinase family enzyme
LRHGRGGWFGAAGRTETAGAGAAIPENRAVIQRIPESSNQPSPLRSGHARQAPGRLRNGACQEPGTAPPAGGCNLRYERPIFLGLPINNNGLSTAPVFVVFNPHSGQADATQAIIREQLTAVGRLGELMVIEGRNQVGTTAAAAVRKALAHGGVVAVAGGDGTINSVAQAVLASGRPFGVIPRGTFNYFARNHGIPLDAAGATRALIEGRLKPVQVGLANGKVFLVNASLGLYPELLQDREVYKSRYGRNKLVAFWSALVSLLREHRQLRMVIEHEGGSRIVRTPTLFVGNNRLQLEQVGVPESSVLEHGGLAGIMLRRVGPHRLLWMLLRGALGRLGEEKDVIHFYFTRMSIRPALPYGRSRMKLATDGEIAWQPTPIEFRVAPQRLSLIVPVDARPEAG